MIAPQKAFVDYAVGIVQNFTDEDRLNMDQPLVDSIGGEADEQVRLGYMIGVVAMRAFLTGEDVQGLRHV